MHQSCQIMDSIQFKQVFMGIKNKYLKNNKKILILLIIIQLNIELD
jgi:hypothetical protein